MLSWLKNLFSKIRPESFQGPTGLPAPINDNQYLAASANAGVLDRQTGAYDKYLFEDSEIPEMPYEAAVDGHLSLMSQRLHQRFKRFISKAELQKIKYKKLLDSRSLNRSYVENSLKNVKSELDQQLKILEGSASGKQGLFWPGEVPTLTNPILSRIKLWNRFLVFIIVGGVDLLIVRASFSNLQVAFWESWMLTAPAVAAQLAFPHLAGQRISYVLHGLSKRISVWIEIFLLTGVWLTFVYIMSQIRVQYIVTLLQRQGQSQASLAQLEQIFQVLNPVLLISLGGWLIFLAIRDNPHEVEALRAKLRIRSLERHLLALKRRELRASKKFEDACESSKALSEELDIAINSSRRELSEAAKSIYRRALINEMADPEFTRSYYGESEAKNE